MSGVAILLYALEVLPPNLSSHTYPNIKGVQYSRQREREREKGLSKSSGAGWCQALNS